MSEGNQNEQDQRQQRTDQPQDFNISIQDILENGNPLDTSDATFANLNHGNSVEDGSQVFARLPAELQHIFSTNDTDDLFGTSGPGGDGGMAQLNQAMWAKSQDQAGASSQGPWMIPNSGSISLAQQPPLMAPMPSVSAAMSQPQNMSNTSTQPTPAPAPVSAPVPAPSGATSTTLLDNITANLPADRKNQFIELFRKLQNNNVTADQFLAQAKNLLGHQQYQQLENLKNKPAKQVDKRVVNSPQTDSQRSSPGASSSQQQQQQKKSKMENIPAGMPMGPPQGGQTSMFKTPAIPAAAGLQIPRNTQNAAGMQSMMKPATSTPSSAPTQPDRIDYDTLTDVMGYAGVDLKEEVEHFLRDGEAPGGFLPDGIDRSKTQEFMNTDLLRERVLKLAKPLAITNIDSDFVSYLALATQDRLRTLLEQMVAASKHRIMSQSASEPPPVDENGRPLYRIVVQQDVRKQLLAIERAEREEERIRKERLAERAERGQGDGETGEDGRPKKKKKDKEAGQASARGGIHDDLRKGGNSSESALMRAIGVRKSWMLTGNQPGMPPSIPGAEADAGAGRGRGRPKAKKPEGAAGKRGGRGGGRGDGFFLPPSSLSRGGRFGDPNAHRVTVRDAIFALEQDTETHRGSGQRTLLKTYNQWLK